MTKYHKHKLKSGKEYWHLIIRKHKTGKEKARYHKHVLPSGKEYWHPVAREHIEITEKRKRLRDRLIPKRVKKPISRVTLGTSYYAIEDTSGTPSPFLTIYVWVLTRNPQKYKEIDFKNEISRIKHQLFVDWGTKAKEHWEENVESDEKYDLTDAGIDMGEYTGFEVQRLDDDEVLNRLDNINKSAIFYGKGGNKKEEYKF